MQCSDIKSLENVNYLNSVKYSCLHIMYYPGRASLDKHIS